MMPSLVVPYDPSPKQVRFHISDATEVVYGGAKGGGKSCALVMECLAYALEHTGATCYIFRETYDDLEANIIDEWKSKVPSDLYNYNESKHIAQLVNGSRVLFRYISNKQDADGYQGRSIDWIGVDELTKHEESWIQVLLSCLRSPKGFPPKFRATCNPGGIGHGWVKRRFIDATRHGEDVIIDPVSGDTIAFVPANVYDNTTLMSNDPAYVRRLENLPEVQRRAFLLGDWDIFEGQYYPEWRHDIHVCQPFAIPDYWKRFRSLDYGLDTTACYWWAVDSSGKCYIYRELYEPNINLTQAAKKILDMTSEKEHITYTVCSPDLWNRRQDTGKAGVEVMNAAGLQGLGRADNRRIPGWRLLREYLAPYEDEQGVTSAHLVVFNTCPHITRTLPELIHDDKDPEDVSDKCEDHGPESVRYGVMSRPPLAKAPQGPPKRPTREDLAKQHKAKLVKASTKQGKYEW
jgi:hypothetical protein